MKKFLLGLVFIGLSGVGFFNYAQAGCSSGTLGRCLLNSEYGSGYVCVHVAGYQDNCGSAGGGGGLKPDDIYNGPIYQIP